MTTPVQVTGTLGAPNATTTIPGNQLPPPAPEFGGVIEDDALQSTEWWPPRIVPPADAPNILMIMTDDAGFAIPSTFGGVIPTPAMDALAADGLRYNRIMSTSLCSPTRAAMITGRNHHSVGFGVIAEQATGFPYPVGRGVRRAPLQPANDMTKGFSMHMTRRLLLASTFLSAATAITPAAAEDYKMTTPIAPGVASPEFLETSIGLLRLEDGVPTEWSTDKIYDNLDRSRALQAYLLAIPIVNQVSMRNTLKGYGPINTTDVIWEDLVDSKTVELTANDNVVYSFIWLDTTDGPLVLESPPDILGLIDDVWYRWVEDVGITGPDKGKGGKYLILPPDYTGDVPDGYFVVRPTTYGNWFPFRSFLNAEGDPKPGVEKVKDTLKIYPLSASDNPPEMKYVNLSGVPSNFVAPQDYSFWELLNQAIQQEPPTGSDPTTLGLFASIGIEKDKPFAPDERMKKILTDAANIGATTTRTLAYRMRQRDGYVYSDGYWRKPFFGGYKFEVSPGVANLDGATFFYFIATGVTPAMAEEMVGEGSQYPWAALDADGNPFDGGKTYKLTLPKDIPAKRFWSAIVYDTQTRSMLQTDQQFPSVSSQDKNVKFNEDGSVDVWFGPEAPDGMEHNWVQTIPGKGWFMILRLYGPLEAWFDQSWRPGEIELVSK